MSERGRRTPAVSLEVLDERVRNLMERVEQGFAMARTAGENYAAQARNEALALKNELAELKLLQTKQNGAVAEVIRSHAITSSLLDAHLELGQTQTLPQLHAVEGIVADHLREHETSVAVASGRAQALSWFDKALLRGMAIATGSVGLWVAIEKAL